jgi:hypothetical protein
VSLVRSGGYTQVLIPSIPLHTQCEQCSAERPFRLLAHVRFQHLGYVFRWDYEEDILRICAACTRAYRMTAAEVQSVIPTYRPAATKQRRRLVQLVFFVPMLAYVVVWHLSKYFAH